MNPDIESLLTRNGGSMELTAILSATAFSCTELFAKLNTLEALGKITITPGGWNKSATASIKRNEQKPKSR